jgi:type VI secretion system protein ImpL
VYDRFFAANLEKLVDTTRIPWTWRPDSVAASQGMLAQFEQAARIRRMFFPAGSKAPKLSFVVGLSNLDLAATRFYLMVEGQNVAIKPGEEIGRPMEWPGSQNAGFAYATFEDRIAAPVRALEFSGPWAWFRFIDTAMDPSQMQARSDQNLFSVLTVQTPQQHRARITIQAQNPDANPFGVRDWRRFTCGS